MKDHTKPLIGITIGDINGIGPEIIIKTFLDARVMDLCTPVIYGSSDVLNQYKKILHLPDFQLQIIKKPSEHKKHKLNLIECSKITVEVTPGQPTTQSGVLALQALEQAIEDAKSGDIDAIVTAPLSKKNISESLPDFIGHTEFLAEKCNGEALMILSSDKLKVAMVTTHIPLMKVKEAVTIENIIKKTEALNRSLINDFGVSRPKIAVLGLNPHAGENGIMGDEEVKIIAPAVAQVKTKGVLAFGPYPSDGFFGAAKYMDFDGVLAMYHDQALIPFKTLCFEDGVNFTAGLDIVRTSPDHGTAYEIAGNKSANESSFRSALYLACDVVQKRKTTETVVTEA